MTHTNSLWHTRLAVLSFVVVVMTSHGLTQAATDTTTKAADKVTLAKKPSVADVVEHSQATDWRTPDPENILYLELASGRVIIELAPSFAPLVTANIRALVREHYFDGLAFIRSQDNYVVQFGDPDEKREIKTAKATIPAEFDAPISASLPFKALPDLDTYAPQVGLSQGFHVARAPKQGRAWMTHCYGAVGVARDVAADSGNGSQLYVIIGNAPRHLDKNISLAGRVIQGMELLSTLPRGSGKLGFYEKPEQYVVIQSVRIAADVPETERTRVEVMRTDTKTFDQVIDAVRTRGGDWFKDPVGHVELCNVPVPVRVNK